MAEPLEGQIEQWRGYLRRRQVIRPVDAAELEDHLRGEVSALVAAGLAEDEAFLIAVKRMGAIDAISNEFAREHSERLWKQLVLGSGDGVAPDGAARTEAVVVFALALLAALAVKVPAFFGLQWGRNENNAFYGRNFSLFVLPLLAGYFVWKRPRPWLPLALLFAAGAVLANVYPLGPDSDTGVLTALHLPIALWLLVGMAYAGRRWHESARRMDFVRFSGELFIYYALIALGGVALMGFTIGMFKAIGVDAEPVVQWLMPCGMVGAVLIGSWLVEAKQSVIENMAPVLTRIFTPLFTVSLLTFLATMVWTGRGIDIERDALIAFDLALALVLGLLLYSISARDPEAPPGGFDLLLVLLLISALVADGFALAAIAARISEFGFTPNRVAALGENVLLLVNLAGSAVLYVRFLRGQAGFGGLERWQTAYLPAFSIWAAAVVVAFPPLFHFR
jgi:hypothetical protein